MARMGEVTLETLRHLPAHRIATRMRSGEHGESQAEEKRPNRAFFRSQARGKVLHERNLSRRQGQATKHGQGVSLEPGSPICGQPNRA